LHRAGAPRDRGEPGSGCETSGRASSFSFAPCGRMRASTNLGGGQDWAGVGSGLDNDHRGLQNWGGSGSGTDVRRGCRQSMAAYQERAAAAYAVVFVSAGRCAGGCFCAVAGRARSRRRQAVKLRWRCICVGVAWARLCWVITRRLQLLVFAFTSAKTAQ
jgi:hypothetical protein